MSMKKYYKKKFMIHIRQKLLHTFISNFVKPGSAVIDLGANTGEFSDYIVRKFKADVYAIEPVPELFNRILTTPHLKKFQYCISNQNKLRRLQLSNSQCATLYDNVSESEKVISAEGITLRTFLESNNIDSIALLKVDIEGAEVEMFEGLDKETLAKIDQITVEFHDFLWPELKFRVENIKRRLSEDGFYCIPFTFFNNGDVLFVRRGFISRCSYFYLKYFIKYVMGLGRILKRIFI